MGLNTNMITRLPDELLAEFKEYCKVNNTTMSEQVRALVEGLLRKPAPPDPVPSSPTVEKKPAVVVTTKDPRAEIKKTEDAYGKVMLARKHGY